MASRMGNSGELARDLRGAIVTAVLLAKERDLDESVYKGERTTGKRAGHGWSRERESYKGERICYKGREGPPLESR